MQSTNLFNKYKRIWYAFNPSTDSKEITKHIKKFIRNRQHRIDDEGNIFIGDFSTVKPCIVAHLDSVHHSRIKRIKYNQKNNSISSPQGIGGDDKCGIIAGLELLRRGLDVNVLFTVEEEIGGSGAYTVDVLDVENVSYFIEVDRYGHNEIITQSGLNTIASDEMIESFKPFMDAYGFHSSTNGIFTDVNILTSTAKRCAVNVSCGYYNHHTKKEYVRLDELENTICFIASVVSSVDTVFIWDASSLKTLSYPALGTGTFNKWDYFSLSDLIEEYQYLGYGDDVVDAINQAYSLGLEDGRLMSRSFNQRGAIC
jgi:di/tripeptidase